MGYRKPVGFLQVERASPKKVNVWCRLFNDKVIGPFFINEATIKQDNFLDVLLQFAFPEVRDRQPLVIFQLDGTPPL